MTEATYRYSYMGMQFYQSELTLKEDGIVRSAIKTAYGGMTPREGTTIAELISKLEEANGVKAILPVILKRYEPTPLHAWWNRVCERRIKKRSGCDSIFDALPVSLIAKVIGDFFVLNPGWLAKFATIAHVSDWTRRSWKRENGQPRSLSTSSQETT